MFWKSLEKYGFGTILETSKIQLKMMKNGENIELLGVGKILKNLEKS